MNDCPISRLGCYSRISPILELHISIALTASAFAIYRHMNFDHSSKSAKIKTCLVRRMRKESALDVLNISLNQTISRTIITSLTTLLVLAALFFVGGEIIQSFSAALIIGVMIGTYSSIYIASPVILALGVSKQDLMPVEKEGVDLPDSP